MTDKFYVYYIKDGCVIDIAYYATQHDAFASIPENKKGIWKVRKEKRKKLSIEKPHIKTTYEKVTIFDNMYGLKPHNTRMHIPVLQIDNMIITPRRSQGLTTRLKEEIKEYEEQEKKKVEEAEKRKKAIQEVWKKEKVPSDEDGTKWYRYMRFYIDINTPYQEMPKIYMPFEPDETLLEVSMKDGLIKKYSGFSLSVISKTKEDADKKLDNKFKEIVKESKKK